MWNSKSMSTCHSVAGCRYAPPDEWLDEAVRCVVAAVQEELDEQDSLTDQEDTGEGGAEQGDAASSAGQGAAVGAQQVAAWRTENGTIGGSVAGDGGRHSRARRRSRAPAGVHVTLLAKLLWGCAHLGYQPSPAQLELLTDSAQWQLSHTRSRGTVSACTALQQQQGGMMVLGSAGSQCTDCRSMSTPTPASSMQRPEKATCSAVLCYLLPRNLLVQETLHYCQSVYLSICITAICLAVTELWQEPAAMPPTPPPTPAPALPSAAAGAACLGAGAPAVGAGCAGAVQHLSVPQPVLPHLPPAHRLAQAPRLHPAAAPGEAEREW